MNKQRITVMQKDLDWEMKESGHKKKWKMNEEKNKMIGK
jgi:hypothetical protein